MENLSQNQIVLQGILNSISVIYYRTKKEIVIHSLYYDFFTNQNSPQPSIHFRLMVKRM